MERFFGFLGCVLAVVGCAASPPPAAPDVLATGDSILAGCEKDESDEDVRAYYCGQLTAVEAVVLSASEHDLDIAFERFAASFSGSSPRRVDSVYSSGEARHTWMRLEGTGDRGTLEAQMVAVELGGGVRLVTCSTRDAKTPCGPVVSSLVHGKLGRAN
jgi:hypothetical protein